MSEVIDWIDKLQGLGVGALALLFLYITNKWWAAQLADTKLKHESEKKQIRADFQTVIEGKDTVISDLSGQLRAAAEQSRSDMERHLERQVDQTRRVEEALASNTSAVAALQEVVRGISRGGAG